MTIEEGAFYFGVASFVLSIFVIIMQFNIQSKLSSLKSTRKKNTIKSINNMILGINWGITRYVDAFYLRFIEAQYNVPQTKIDYDILSETHNEIVANILWLRSLLTQQSQYLPIKFIDEINFLIREYELDVKYLDTLDINTSLEEIEGFRNEIGKRKDSDDLEEILNSENDV